MPFVLVDTSVSLPATLSPRGFRRRFFVILAFGAVTYEVGHRNLELDELVKEAADEGGAVGGLDQAMQRIALLEDRRAALEELLPHGTPDDWTAVGSAPLFGEYERKVREIGDKLNPSLRPEDAPVLRRQIEALCIAGSPPFDPSTSPALTRDPHDDPIVYSALLADADLLISDDRDIVPDGIEQFYERGDRSTTAMTFDRMIERFFPAAEVDFSEIDGSWLGLAYSAMAADAARHTGDAES